MAGSMEPILAYAAGLLTLINPCVLPVLPIVLAGSLQAHRLGPVALAGGMGVTFVVLGLGIAAAGRSFGLTEETVAQTGAVLMLGFGLVLLVPRLSSGFALATAGVGTRADAGIDRLDRGSLAGQAGTGALLAAVWSPCIGPTLGGAISLASQGESLLRAGTIMVGFALGVGTIILALGYGARAALARRRALMQRLAERSRPILGVVFVVVGTAILFRVHHMIEAWAIQTLPPWLIDLSVSI
jgi:cytochrome c biogenesis protein CcdA